MTAEKKHFLITGAGPVGLTMALLLQKAGNEVEIYEKRQNPRTSSESGRSINLALSDRGFRSLGLIELEKKVKKDIAIPMTGRMVHTTSGISFQPYSQNGNAIYSVSRQELNLLLIQEAEAKNIDIHFEFACKEYDAEHNTIHFEKHSKPYVLSNPGMILGCDGAFSALRKSLVAQSAILQDLEQTYAYAYKELTIPAGSEGSWQMETNALHIWPQKSFMLIALPNTDGSFTCTLFLPQKGAVSFEQIAENGSCLPFFESNFPELLLMIPDLEQQFSVHPISTIFMESCQPWNIGTQLLLLGDAAHAIVPFYGQGLNCGLEDARLFYEFMLQNDFTKETIHRFQALRKPDTDAIGELALQNFSEMSNAVQDKTYLLKRKIETSLKIIFPEMWHTQYELVTFSHTPYAKALQTGIENQRKLDLILNNELLTEHLLQNTLNERAMKLLSQIIL